MYREHLRAAVIPALVLGAVALAVCSQFFLTRLDVPVPSPGYGFLLAAALLGAAMYLRGRQTEAEGSDGLAGVTAFQLPVRWEIVLVAAVMLLATFFRFWRFLEFPPGVWFDEAVTSGDALWILDNDRTTIWRETNFGRATLFLYMLIASFEVFGYTIFAMRFVPAIAGLAAVFAFYFLARWLVGPVPALVATALLAVSRWAVTFSRVSWEAALQPLFEIMAVYFFVRALETRGRLGYFFWFMAGGSLAAGIYTYLAFRFVPIVMAMFLLYIAATRWDLIWRSRTGILVYGVSFVIVLAPLANFALNNQDQFLERTREVNVFREVDEKDTYAPLRSNVQRSVEMINVRGDHNGRHNLPNAPMVDELTGAVFILGLAAALISYRNWRRGTLPIWLIIMLLPGLFTISIENPSAIRGIGAIPPIFLLAAVGVSVVYASLARTRVGLVTFGVLALSLVAGSTALNYYDVFHRQANSQLVWEAFTPKYALVAEAVADRADDNQVLVSQPYLGHPIMPILTRGVAYEDYSPGEHVVFRPTPRDIVIVLDANQYAILPHLSHLYPNLSVEETNSPYDDPLFATVTIPASDVAAVHDLELTYTTAGESRTERAGLGREWNANDLAAGPITAVWEGHYWSPGHDVLFVPSGAWTVAVNGERVAADTLLSLGVGEHHVRVEGTISEPGRAEVTLETPQGDVDAAELLYGKSLGEGGFEVIIHEGNDFTGEVAMIGRVPFAVPIVPVMPRTGAVAYRTELNVRATGTYKFALDGASSSQLLVNGELIVDNGGSHASRRVEGTIVLESGRHELIVQYVAGSHADWSLYVEAPGTGSVRLDGGEVSPPSEPYTPPAIVTLSPDPASGVTIAELPQPLGIAALPDGTVAVSSGRTIGILDESLSLIRTISPDVESIGDLAATEDGRIVIVDRERKSLIVISSDGEELLRVDDAFESAFGVDAVGDRALVASPAGGRIYSVSLTTGEVTNLPISSDQSETRPRQPSDVVIGDDGTIFIADFEGESILISPDGENAISVRGARGTGLQLPHLAVSGKLLFVSEGVNDRLVIRDKAGGNRGVFVFPTRHGGTRPVGIDVDAQGRVLVAGANGIVYRLVVEIPPQTQAELDALP